MIPIIIDDESILIEEPRKRRKENAEIYRRLFEELTREQNIPPEHVPEYIIGAFEYLRHSGFIWNYNRNSK